METNNRLIIAIDVDGVLNPDVNSRQRSRLWYHHGWRRKALRIGAGGGPVQLIVNPEAGIWLQKLARDTGAELVWATRWNDLANEHVAPLIGLPKLPVIVTPPYPRPKAVAVTDYAAGRDLVWFDDEPREIEIAQRLREHNQLFHGILTDPKVGLTIEHIDEAREWLAGL
jgi:HAD domain in Swiss Army Knife RNA repair proteins